MIRLVDVLSRTRAWLAERGVPHAEQQARLLLGHVLHMAPLQLYLHHDQPLTDEELAALRPLVKRRGQREPLAYILGSVGFHSIDLHITPGVLVPRPCTEALVEAALRAIRAGTVGTPSSEPTEADATEPSPVFIADVGSGSGAVGLAIAANLPQARVYATDVSPVALELTRKNTDALGLGQRVAVLQGDLLSPIPAHRPVDWVVSNPPYIPSGQIDGLEPEVRDHEPRLALDGGPDGLAVYRTLIPAAAHRARRGVLVEIGHDQGAAVAQIFAASGLEQVTVTQDAARHDRVVAGLVPQRR